MDLALPVLIAGIVILVIFVFGFLALLAKFYQKVDQGHAMIVNTMRAEPEVTFTGRLVIPILHRREIMDVSLKTIEIERSGKEGLICRDNMRADIKVKFFVPGNARGPVFREILRSPENGRQVDGLCRVVPGA